MCLVQMGSSRKEDVLRCNSGLVVDDDDNVDMVEKREEVD